MPTKSKATPTNEQDPKAAAERLKVLRAEIQDCNKRLEPLWRAHREAQTSLFHLLKSKFDKGFSGIDEALAYRGRAMVNVEGEGELRETLRNGEDELRELQKRRTIAASEVETLAAPMIVERREQLMNWCNNKIAEIVKAIRPFCADDMEAGLTATQFSILTPIYHRLDALSNTDAGSLLNDLDEPLPA